MRRTRELAIDAMAGMREFQETLRQYGPLDLDWPPRCYELEGGRLEMVLERRGHDPIIVRDANALTLYDLALERLGISRQMMRWP